jgi:hypothetical protein
MEERQNREEAIIKKGDKGRKKGYEIRNKWKQRK